MNKGNLELTEEEKKELINILHISLKATGLESPEMAENIIFFYHKINRVQIQK